MKIIQSFYQIDKNITFWFGDDNSYLLNFYSLLLSYLTIKKIYGFVEMYCNNAAYDSMIKYIPYDNIIIEETSIVDSNNYKNQWGLLKFNVYEKQDKPFIHIDGDVFLFKDVLSNYMKNTTYDVIVQSKELYKDSIYDDFYFSNVDKLVEYGFIDKIKMQKSYKKYSKVTAYNCGVVGFRDMDFMKEYISMGKKMNELFRNNKITGNFETIFFEQYVLYSLSEKLEKNIYEILPENDILKYGYNKTGNIHGFTHLLGGNKYVGSFISLVRNKIIKDFPNHRKNIENFENSLNGVEFTMNNHEIENKLLKDILKKW